MPEYTHSQGSSIRSSIDSQAVSNEYLPETLLEPDRQRTSGARRFSTSSAGSRVSTRVSKINSIVDSVRDENFQTHLEEGELSKTASGILRKQWTLNDALDKLDTRGSRKSSGDDEESLNEEQEMIKNMGYTEEDLLDPPPDGGLKLWTNAVCVGLLSLSTWGINSSYGVFLSHYITTDYFPGASSYDFALIGSIVVGLSQIMSPFVIIMMKVVGFKETLILGTLLQTASYILASFATKLWHLYLTQGVMVGFSFLLVWCPATMIIPTWFLRRRGLANGIGLCGSGLGGVIFSLSVNRLIQQTGSQVWALRMLAIVGFVICSVCIVFTSPRNYKHPEVSVRSFRNVSSAIFDMTAWKEPATILVSLWFAIANMAYTILLFSVSSYARAVGLTAQQSSALTALLNAGQTLGRPSIGLFADKFGRINFAFTGQMITLILIFALWLNARTYASLIVYTFIGGAILPVANTLNQPLMSDAIEPSRFPAAYSLVFFSLGVLSFPCEVIGMQLRSPDNKRFPYLYSQVFTGLLFVISDLLLIPLRQIKIKKMIENRMQTTKLRIRKLKSGKSEQDDISGEMELLESRLENYRRLMSPGSKGYIRRAFYPIKA